MGNIVSVVMCYRLNKEHNEQMRVKKEKKNICSYLYGKCHIKDVSGFVTTNPLLREKESRKDL